MPKEPKKSNYFFDQKKERLNDKILTRKRKIVLIIFSIISTQVFEQKFC